MALKVLKAAKGKLGARLTRKGPSTNPGFAGTKKGKTRAGVSMEHARGEANVPLKNVGKRRGR